MDDIQLTRQELKEIVHDSVHDTLMQMGIDVSSPIDMQRDFQHLRYWRMTAGALRMKSVLTIFIIIISGILAAAWAGFKFILQVHE